MFEQLLLMCIYVPLPKYREEPVLVAEYECQRLITCEPADWIGIDGNGRAKPKDHCTYKTTTEYSTTIPHLNFESYGESCKLIKLVGQL